MFFLNNYIYELVLDNDLGQRKKTEILTRYSATVSVRSFVIVY